MRGRPVEHLQALQRGHEIEARGGSRPVVEAGRQQERRTGRGPAFRVVMAQDPAPPGGVEQGMREAGPLEVQQGDGVPIAQDDIDRREVAVREDRRMAAELVRQSVEQAVQDLSRRRPELCLLYTSPSPRD